LKQNKDNIPGTGSKILQIGAETVSKTGAGIAPEQEQEQLQNRGRNIVQSRCRNRTLDCS